MKILYKRDTTNGIRTWTVELDGGKYRTLAGTLGGKQVVSEWTTAEAKNVGRSNETSAAAQALKEVEAMYVKKKKEGYVEDMKNVDKVSLVKPMLANKYKEGLKFPVFAQPKLDGFRCIINKDGMWSRKNERFLSCPHIAAVFVPLCELYGISFDGELYNHDLKADFNTIQSLITKRTNLTEEDYAESRKSIKFYMYDMVDVTKKFSDRYSEVVKFYTTVSGIMDVASLVETHQVDDQNALDALYATWFEGQGYEGQMIRLDGVYEHKRSKNLLKRKTMQDAEFIIVDIEEGTGNRSGMAGRVTLRTKEGKLFGAGIAGGEEFYKWLLQHREEVLGERGTVTYQELTPDGIPRFPVFKAVRKD